jgi:hypothetical protein
MKSKLSIVLFLCMTFCTGAALAGGLEEGTKAAEEFSTWLYGFIGACAVGYLGFKGFQVWSDKAQWIDFLTAIGKVAAVGGTLGLTTWAWAVFA